MLKPMLLGLAMILPAMSTTHAYAEAATGEASGPGLFASAPALSADDLSAARGGQDTTYAAMSEQLLSARNSGNSVTADTVNNGAVNFGNGALQGFNGLGNFVLNTGNNNNLQGSLNVTIFMAPSSALH